MATAGSAPENRKLSSKTCLTSDEVGERTQTAGGCYPAVTGNRKISKWSTGGAACDRTTDQLGKAACRVQENTSWFQASLKKRLTAEGNKANRLKRLWLGINLHFPLTGWFFCIPVEIWLDGLMSAISSENSAVMQWNLFRHLNYRWNDSICIRVTMQHRWNAKMKRTNNFKKKIYLESHYWLQEL